MSKGIKEGLIWPIIVGLATAAIVGPTGYLMAKAANKDAESRILTANLYPSQFQSIPSSSQTQNGLLTEISQKNIQSNIRLLDDSISMKNYSFMYISNNTNEIIDNVSVRLSCKVAVAVFLGANIEEYAAVDEINIGLIPPQTRRFLAFYDAEAVPDGNRCKALIFSSVGQGRVSLYEYRTDGSFGWGWLAVLFLVISFFVGLFYWGERSERKKFEIFAEKLSKELVGKNSP